MLPKLLSKVAGLLVSGFPHHEPSLRMQQISVFAHFKRLCLVTWHSGNSSDLKCCMSRHSNSLVLSEVIPEALATEIAQSALLPHTTLTNT